MKKVIIGAGGFAMEVYYSLSDFERENCIFFVEDKFYSNQVNSIFPLSKFNPLEHEAIIAIGDPHVRNRIVNSLPVETKYFTHVHPSVIILDSSTKIGEGSIICAGTIITTNVVLGKHSQLNLQSTIGHDTIIGDYFTTAPGAKISGNCIIGNRVYVGTNSSVREKISICDDVTIGLSSGVVKNIEFSGVYGGIPCKKIK